MTAKSIDGYIETPANSFFATNQRKNMADHLQKLSSIGNNFLA